MASLEQTVEQFLAAFPKPDPQAEYRPFQICLWRCQVSQPWWPVRVELGEGRLRDLEHNSKDWYGIPVKFVQTGSADFRCVRVAPWACTRADARAGWWGGAARATCSRRCASTCCPTTGRSSP